MKYPKLTPEFYLRTDVVQISRELIGKVLVTDIGGVRCAGKIVETEAYRARDDKACHAYNGKRTPRNEVMYRLGGTAYVYICYGIHPLFNVVTNVLGVADAVLIRALEPLEGIQSMIQRRKIQKPERRIAGGPGCLTRAMGITIAHNGSILSGDTIWIEDRKIHISEGQIIAGSRVGIAPAGKEAVSRPWRFREKGNTWVSPAK